MLTLDIPRAEAAKPRQIAIKAVSEGHTQVAAHAEPEKRD